MNKPRTTTPRHPRALSAEELATATGGSLNTYISKCVGEKQGDFKGGVETPPPPPPPPPPTP